jgi:hypothetical protein
MKLRPRLTGSTVPTPLLLAILAESSVARAEQPDAPCHPNPDAAAETPFFHAELVPLLMMHVDDQPVPPRRRNPNVPVGLDAVILRSLAKDPKQRQQSCRELGQELIAIRDRYA